MNPKTMEPDGVSLTKGTLFPVRKSASGYWSNCTLRILLRMWHAVCGLLHSATRKDLRMH